MLNVELPLCCQVFLGSLVLVLGTGMVGFAQGGHGLPLQLLLLEVPETKGRRLG